MKQSKKFSFIILALAGVLVVAMVAYNYLSQNYSLANSVPTSTSNGTGTTTSAKTASDFTVLDNLGNEAKLSHAFGKPTVVNFWATWCGPCKSELAHFEKMYQQYGDDINFMMVNLTDGSRDTVSKVEDFVSAGKYTFPVYFDTKLNAANTYSIMSIPTTLFINSDGTIMKTYIGAMSEHTLQNYIDSLLSQTQNQ